MNGHDKPRDHLAEDVDAVLRSATGRPITPADDKAEGWLGGVLDQAKELARDHLGGDLDELSFALDGLERLRGVEGFLAGVGVRGLRSVMRLVYQESDHKAREAWRYWLDDRATFDERREFQNAASVEAQRRRIEQELAWEHMLGVFADIGKQTLKVVIPVLLAGL